MINFFVINTKACSKCVTPKCERGAQERRRIAKSTQHDELECSPGRPRTNHVQVELADHEQVGFQRAQLAYERIIAHALHARLVHWRQFAQELLQIRQVRLCIVQIVHATTTAHTDMCHHFEHCTPHTHLLQRDKHGDDDESAE